MDAWLKQSSNANATMKKPTNSLNYSKFDKIVDSDDEEEEKQRRRQARRAVQPRSPGDVPPHLRAAYARVTIAQERGDTKELRAAMLELEQQLQAMPDEFKEQLKPSMDAIQQQKLRQKAAGLGAATSAARGSLNTSDAAAAQGVIDEQLRQLEKAQSAIAGLDEPEKIHNWLQSVGITPEEIATAEQARDPKAAMAALAQRAMEKSMGEGGAGGLLADLQSVGGASSAAKAVKEEEMRQAKLGLEAQQKKLAEAAAALEEQRALVEKQRARKDELTSQLAEVEARKAEQGKKVDESVELAKADLAKQAAASKEQEEARTRLVASLKERGNLAMQNDDKAAARAFYTEALEIRSLPSEERAKLLGNRSACLLGLKRADLALADAEEAAELMPQWGKAIYRLGCLQDENGDWPSAVETLTRAKELLPGAVDVAARLKSVESKRQRLKNAVAAAEVGSVGRLRAEAEKAEAEATAAEVTHGAAVRSHERLQAAVKELGMNPALREQCAEAYEAAGAKEEEVADLAIRATKARKKADEARKSADVAGGGAVPDTQPQAKAALAAEAKAEEAKAEEAKAEEAKAGFAAAKAEATAHFKRGEHSQAAAAFGELIRWCKGGKGGPAVTPLLPASFARQSLPGLLSNRAMCLIEAGKLEECAADCDAALAAIDALGTSEPPPPGLAFKLSLRRAEANRRLGRMDMVLRASEACTQLAQTEDEKAAAGYLSLQCAVLSVE